MSNTSRLYDAMNSFIRQRAANREAYLQTMQRIEGYKGSARYDTEAQAARKAREDANNKAREECRAIASAAIKAMREVGSKQKLTPPTAEMIAILQALKLRSTFNAAEFDMAANSMDGNALALSALNDIADELAKKNPNQLKQTHTNYTAQAKNALAGDALNSVIDSIARTCGSLLKTDGAKTAAAEYEKSRVNRFGGVYDEDGLPQQEEFATEADFYQYCAPWGTTPEAIMQAVNE